MYLRLYLHYRYLPELGAQDWVAVESQKKIRTLMDEFGLDDTPSSYINRKMALATYYYADYRRFDNKFPYEGGTWEQPADWLRPVRCVMRAYGDAEREKQIEKAGKTPSASGAEDSEIMYVP